MPLGYKEVSDIIKLIDASELEEFVVEVGDIKIEVRRKAMRDQSAVGGAPLGRATVETEAPTSFTVPTLGDAKPTTAPEKAQTSEVPGTVELRAPMVGTFYRRPLPDAAPFVEVGSIVKQGDPVCLVEVMKLFTTIYSQTAGRIVQIGPDDADLVEYDQLLFLIEPD